VTETTLAMPPGTPGIVASDAERRELPVWRLLLRRPTFVTGALILLFWVVCAIFGTSIAPHSPLAQQLLATNQAPSGAHWFGTDQLGRDMLSRVIVGARTMLIVAPLATVVGTVLGTALGLALGYLGGVVDLLASRVIEGVLALPALLVIFLFMVPLGVTTLSQVLVIGFIFTPLIARTVRSAVQVERQLDYVPAARLLGERSGWMMFVEILPNVVPTILVEFTVRLGYAVFAVASLAFLGFGVQLSTPNWGTDINANYVVLGAGYWWESLFPALAIASLIIGINLVADSIEQVVVG
jgi:peptide/nickel transport system permease protein